MRRLHHLLKQCNPHSPDLSATTTNNDTHSSYRYTMDEFAPNVFTKEQRDFYEEHGYIIVKNLLSSADVNACNQRFDDLVSNPSLRKNETLVFRDISIRNQALSKQRTEQNEVTKLQDFAYDSVFWKHYFANPQILKYVKAFTGKDIRDLTSMFINKPTDPGTLSSRHPLHQDFFYWPLTNPNRICACWVALQKVNRMNGGLCIVPGTHKNAPVGKVLPHDYPKWNTPQNFAYYGIPEQVFRKIARQRIHIDMAAGDAVFFHPLTVHGSSANLSDGFRRSLCCHFMNSKLCRYRPYDMTLHSGMIKDVASSRKKKGKSKQTTKAKIQFRDIHSFWKFRTRQVTGDCGEWGFDEDELQKWCQRFFKRELTAKQIEMNSLKN